ncbi:glycerophosphodiester phosphodiesterase family protein [Mucilaginibacter sp. UR6-11]|uniref:glycerophosphodiester phosphodiesterase family protein n=1 Tax=Mucilaginibacter sp. UR6-11 TaxID=1435644 RepID=UPI001E61507A|nr:glycerophosphodiester phosphodiesterase family protein [Mucilaginibacter sp. UR6-11]MCC8426535.1 glycerophosphodiester phosphodiesterase [Mucilaginibacter sp. UR6-11]
MKYILSLLITAGSLQVKAQQFDTQAHRGGRGLMPENSIPAMLNGVKLGVQTLELDTRITADGKVVVSHDGVMTAAFMQKPDGSDLTKAEEKQHALYKMTYDSIRMYIEGIKSYPDFPQQQKIRTYKPLLADLIDSVEAYTKTNHLKPVYYNIETKSSASGDNINNPVPALFVKLLMDVITSKHITNRVIIQSFDPRTLQVLHQQMPEVKTAFLIQTGDYDGNIKLLGFNPTILSPEQKIVTPDLVTAAHKNNILVIPWTVNDEAAMKALADLKVDGLISDYPDKLVKLFGSYQK